MTKVEALKLALEALEKIADWHGAYGPFPETTSLWQGMAITTARENFTAIKRVLAEQPEQKQVECMCGICRLNTRLWVGLTDEERDECDWGQGERDYARIIEAKLKEKNT